MLFYRNVFCKIYNRENIMEFFFDKNQMICKDLTNCHPNDNRKGEKSSKISIKQFFFFIKRFSIKQ